MSAAGVAARESGGLSNLLRSFVPFPHIVPTSFCVFSCPQQPAYLFATRPRFARPARARICGGLAGVAPADGPRGPVAGGGCRPVRARIRAPRSARCGGVAGAGWAGRASGRIPERHLWAAVRAVRPCSTALRRLWRCDSCAEGGPGGAPRPRCWWGVRPGIVLYGKMQLQ